MRLLPHLLLLAYDMHCLIQTLLYDKGLDNLLLRTVAEHLPLPTACLPQRRNAVLLLWVIGVLSFLHSGCDSNQNKAVPQIPIPRCSLTPLHMEEPSNTWERISSWPGSLWLAFANLIISKLVKILIMAPETLSSYTPRRAAGSWVWVLSNINRKKERGEKQKKSEKRLPKRLAFVLLSYNKWATS